MDLEAIVAETKDLANEVATGASQKLGAARDSIQDSYRAAKETVADVSAAVVRNRGGKGHRSLCQSESWIAVGAAATIGIAIGTRYAAVRTRNQGPQTPPRAALAG